jgi:hypothetical protein
MPLTTIASYLPTTQAYIQHWTLVNAALGGNASTDMKLSGGYTLANLTADRAALDAAITAVYAAENDLQTAAGNRDIKRHAILTRFDAFNANVRYHLKGTGYIKSIVRKPNRTATQGAVTEALDKMAELWADVNAASGVPNFTPPLLLPGGYSLANFNTELAAMRAAYGAVKSAETNLNVARDARDKRLGPLRDRLVEYRPAVLAKMGPGSEFATSIPALNAPPGSTPDAVQLSAAWNADTNQGDLEWTPCQHAALDHYQLRSCPGAAYKASEEFVVANIPKTQTTFSTSQGLLVPGAKAPFKIYSITDTGNEKGSNSVVVTRA